MMMNHETHTHTQMGRRLIEAGDNAEADWCLTNARQVHSLCLGGEMDEDPRQRDEKSAQELLADILLSCLQLAIATKKVYDISMIA